MNTAEIIIKDFTARADNAKAAHLMCFFRSGPGQYGQGDKFLGLPVPKTREIIKKYWVDIKLREIKTLLKNPYHEIRLAGLLMLVKKYEKGTPQEKQKVYDFYMANLKRANNWDLVDLSCYKIAGAHLHGKDQKPLYDLATSTNLWEQRVAMVSTMYSVKKGYLKTMLDLAEYFLTHEHDLMHKASGWLLREGGKKDLKTLLVFLDKHHRKMPRTMLRYAIEKLPETKRKYYMKKD